MPVHFMYPAYLIQVSVQLKSALLKKKNTSKQIRISEAKGNESVVFSAIEPFDLS